MGPNNKSRSRKDYVRYRLSVLKDFQVPPPPKEMIEKMKDESQMSEVAVDAVFLGCMKKAGW